jgi:hypothetical protein
MYNEVSILQRTLLKGDKDSFVLHSENTQMKCFANRYSDGFKVFLIPSMIVLEEQLTSRFQLLLLNPYNKGAFLIHHCIT